MSNTAFIHNLRYNSLKNTKYKYDLSNIILSYAALPFTFGSVNSLFLWGRGGWGRASGHRRRPRRRHGRRGRVRTLGYRRYGNVQPAADGRRRERTRETGGNTEHRRKAPLLLPPVLLRAVVMLQVVVWGVVVDELRLHLYCPNKAATAAAAQDGADFDVMLRWEGGGRRTEIETVTAAAAGGEQQPAALRLAEQTARVAAEAVAEELAQHLHFDLNLAAAANRAIRRFVVFVRGVEKMAMRVKLQLHKAQVMMMVMSGAVHGAGGGGASRGAGASLQAAQRLQLGAHQRIHHSWKEGKGGGGWGYDLMSNSCFTIKTKVKNVYIPTE